MTASTASTSPVDQPSRVVELLAQQADLYARLESLSGGQAQVLNRDGVNALLGVLGQRQEIIDQVRGLNGDLARYRDRWDEVRAALGDDDRSRVGALVAQIDSRLAAITASDAEARDALASARDRVAADLDQAAVARRAASAYRQPDRRPPLTEHNG